MWDRAWKVAMITLVQIIGIPFCALNHVHVYIRICILVEPGVLQSMDVSHEHRPSDRRLETCTCCITVEPGVRQSMDGSDDNNCTEHWPFDWCLDSRSYSRPLRQKADVLLWSSHDGHLQYRRLFLHKLGYVCCDQMFHWYRRGALLRRARQHTHRSDVTKMASGRHGFSIVDDRL